MNIYHNYKLTNDRQLSSVHLKGLSHEIFGPIFWAVWIYLGLNVNRLWLLNLNDAPFILTFKDLFHVNPCVQRHEY